MPINPTYPGVYIEELPSGSRTLVGVSTSVTAFVGSFHRGPLDRAVQVFSMGDVERELGGLHPNSEASYGLQQFFLNGGSNAWVVRTASGSHEAATAVLRDHASSDLLRVIAGRRMAGEIVRDPGTWGNALHIDIDYDTDDPNADQTSTSQQSTFNMVIEEVTTRDGRRVVLRSEAFRNVRMDPTHARYVVAVVNEDSRLVQLERLSGLTDYTRPVPTGTWGAAGSPAGNINDLDSVDVAIGSTPSQSAVLRFTGAMTSATLTMTQARGLLEAALRAMAPTDPRFSGAVVQVVGGRLRVLAGRSAGGFASQETFNFSGATAGFLGLDAGAVDNVQQYAMGLTTAGTYHGAGTEGANGTLPDAAALQGTRSAKTGMYALEDVDIFNILCIPRASALGAAEFTSLISTAETYCGERRAMLLVDLPENVDTLDEARTWLEDNATLRHANAAAYFPRPRIPDPLAAYRLRAVPPSGTMAGLFARTDATRGVWKAPAGIEAQLRGVSDLAYRLNDPENGQLNPLGLNCLRTMDVAGPISWGARTLVGADTLASQWKYLPVRRLALYLEESLFRGTQWVVFEPNDEPLWAQIRLNVGTFMHGLFRQGAFQGKSPKEAYKVKCDSETTTQADIDRGIVNIYVGFAPLKPAEFVIIQIQQLAGQSPI